MDTKREEIDDNKCPEGNGNTSSVSELDVNPQRPSDLVTYVAIIGKMTLPPFTFRVRLRDINVNAEYLVLCSYPREMVDDKRCICLDVSDCVVFQVIHVEQGEVDVSNGKMISLVFEYSLTAINEVIIWCKVNAEPINPQRPRGAGDLTNYSRQVGRMDTKYFIVAGKDGIKALWKNPAFWVDFSKFNIACNLMPKGVSNITWTRPVSNYIRILMSSYELFNIGYYTESFITAFALCDDLIQQVVKAGMQHKDLGEKEQKRQLRAIKEDRLRVYLSTLLKLCGWKSLEEDNEELFSMVMRANKTRNDIMHGTKRLTRNEARSFLDTLVRTMQWLGSNPFGYVVEKSPPFAIIE